MRKHPTFQYSIIQGAYWSSMASVFGFASVYLVGKGFSNIMVGYVIAAGGLLSAILQPVFGNLADRSRRPILHVLISLLSAVMIITAAAAALSSGKWMTALLFGTLVAFVQIISPLVNAIGVFAMEKGVPVDFGICRGIGSLSYAAVAALLGVLVHRMNNDVVLYSVIIIYAVLIPAIITFGRGFGGQNSIRRKRAETPESPGLISFFEENKAFLPVLFGNMLVFISHNFTNNYMFQILSSHGYSGRETGFAVSIAAFSELPALFFLTVLSHKMSAPFLYKLSVFFMFIKNLCLCFASSLPAIYLTMCLQLAGFGLYAGISVIYVKEFIQPQHQARGQSLMTASVTAGAVIGSLAGGWLLDSVGVFSSLMISTACVLLGTVIICIYAGRMSDA